MTIDQEVLNLINQERSNAGLNPLLLQSQLDSAANNHSEEMALRDFFGHSRPGGPSWQDRITDAGYQGSRLAENIFAGLATPADVVQQWMNSRPHRENILDPNLEHIGIGYYHLPNDTGSVNYNHYWTLTFGAGGDPDPPRDETISVGVAPNYTPYSNSNYLNEDVTERVYSFIVNDRSSINLNLHDITSGDDADLYLYRDDGDGVFEVNQDQELKRSRRSYNYDDSINYLAESGTYFARVERYASSQGRLDYELDLSATPDTPYPADDPAQVPNLLPREVDVGRLFSSGSGPQTFSESVGDTDTVDTYTFSLPVLGSGAIHLVDIRLDNLNSDADMRLIEDYNSNGIVDQGEVFDFSVNSGTAPESMTVGLTGGDYFLQVYQYSGDTSYQLTFA